MDVQGVVKSTVVRGEDDFPDGLLRITDCHDCVVYALAPLQYATVAGCSDCTVVRRAARAPRPAGALPDARLGASLPLF